jgi:hypothetical protein
MRYRYQILATCHATKLQFWILYTDVKKQICPRQSCSVKVFPLNEQFASFPKQKQFILFSLGLHLSEQVYTPPPPLLYKLETSQLLLFRITSVSQYVWGRVMTYHTSLLVIIMLVCYRQRVGMAASRLTQAQSHPICHLRYFTMHCNQSTTFVSYLSELFCTCSGKSVRECKFFCFAQCCGFGSDSAWIRISWFTWNGIRIGNADPEA